MELKTLTLYEDKYILALLKPPGVLSQSDSEEDITGEMHIINRLDRPVGGIVLLAKDNKTAAALTDLMQKDGIQKRYLAVVCGNEIKAEADFIDYIMVNKRLNISKIVNKGMPQSKMAHLSYKKLSAADKYSLIEVSLYTGRHHQIRTQLAHHNMPIWGDTKYNPDFKHKRGILPALFAYNLSFVHPITGEEICLKQMPDYGKFTDFMEIYNEI